MGASDTSLTGAEARLVAHGAPPAAAPAHSRLVPRCFHSTLFAAAGVGARPAATGDPAAPRAARGHLSLSAMHGPDGSSPGARAEEEERGAPPPDEGHTTGAPRPPPGRLACGPRPRLLLRHRSPATTAGRQDARHAPLPRSRRALRQSTREGGGCGISLARLGNSGR